MSATRTAWVKFACKGVVSLVLIGCLLDMLDWRQCLYLLGEVRLLPATLSLFSFVILIHLSSWKWKVLLDAHGVHVPLRRLFGYYWIGFFLSNFLPSSVGGDVARLALLRKTGRVPAAAASIFFERLTGFGVLLVLSLWALWVRPAYFDGMGLLPVLRLVAGGFAVFLLLFLLFGTRIADWLGRKGRSRGGLLEKARETVAAVLFYRGRPAAVCFCVLLSVVFYALRILMQYWVLVALGLDFPLSAVVFIAPMIDLITALPVSLNGLGLTEGAIVLFYVGAGLLPAEALAVAVLSRVIAVLASSVGGGILLRQRSTAASAVR